MELLERGTYLAVMENALHQASEAAGQMLLISGEAGIGKSSLVTHFVQSQQIIQRVLWGACDDLFTPRPLGPLHDIARQVGGQLLDLLRSPQERSILLNVVLNQLQSPVIVVFEDVHWADEATLDLLKFLGRRMARTQALLLITFRDDELDQRHPLYLLLGDLNRQPTTRRLRLTPLSVTAVEQLSSGYGIDAGRLHQETGGNPFYLREILAAKEEGIPASIREVVLARVARLSLSGRAVLEAAAIIGPRVEPGLLNQVVQAEAPAISESLKFGFLQANADFFTFRHELVRQTIVTSLPPHQQAFWHQAVLDVLRNAPQFSHDTARLAHHAAAAKDIEAILRFGRAAGEEAASLGMHRAAMSWFDLVMPYADRLTPVDQIELQIMAGVNNQSGDLRKSMAAFMQAAKLAQGANLVDEARLAQAHMAVVNYRLGELQQCDALLAHLLEQKEPAAPDAALNIAYPLQAMRYLLLGEAANAFEYANKARQMALNSGKSEDIIRANQIFGMCTLPLDHQRGLLELKASLHLAFENHFYRAVGTIYANLVMHSLDVYQTVEVDALVTTAKAYLAEHDLDFNLNLVLAWEAMLRLYEGRWAECEAISNGILDVQTAPIVRIPATVARGRLLARRGDFEQAQDLLSEARSLSMKINNQQRIGIYYCAAAELAWMMGKRETVEQLVAEYMETAVKNRLPGFGGEIAYWSHIIGQTPTLYEWMVEPFVLEIRGDWRGAAAGWEALGCPYEQARALAGGDVEAQKAALLLFEQLGAQPLANQVRSQLRQAGVQSIPRGPRATTQKNPFGLTNRQVDVVRLLIAGLTNADIAARLHISPKTVDHHVSAVLGKMGVSTREEAAELGRPFFEGG